MPNEKGNKPSVFSARLQILREHQEYSQKEAAEHLNILPDTYSRYKCDIKEPDFQTLKRIAIFFYVSIDYLLDDEDECVGRDAYLRLIQLCNGGTIPSINNYLTSENAEQSKPLWKQFIRTRNRKEPISK